MCVRKEENDRGETATCSPIRKTVIFSNITFIYKSFMGTKSRGLVFDCSLLLHVLVTMLGILQ